MYYDYSMKKIYLFSVLLLAGATVIQGASTCETRVDRHQNATTTQRVEYCLNDDPAAAEPEGPELVYYGVTAPDSKKQEKEGNGRSTQYFNGKKVRVNRDYVGTKTFPAFENDIPSEQAIIAQQQAMVKTARAQKPARLMDGVVTPSGVKLNFSQPAATSAKTVTTTTITDGTTDNKNALAPTENGSLTSRAETDAVAPYLANGSTTKTTTVTTKTVTVQQQPAQEAVPSKTVKENLATRQKKPARTLKVVHNVSVPAAAPTQEVEFVNDPPVVPATAQLPANMAATAPASADNAPLADDDDLLMQEESFVPAPAAPGI